jgi:hypothetical protein
MRNRRREDSAPRMMERIVLDRTRTIRTFRENRVSCRSFLDSMVVVRAVGASARRVFERGEN